MKKIIYIFVLLIFAGNIIAQQSAQYSQFMMNEYGLNPATAGSGKGLMVMIGQRTQWRGFAYAPETNFAGITKNKDGELKPFRAKSTRVYAKQGGKWKLVHSNFAADPIPD